MKFDPEDVKAEDLISAQDRIEEVSDIVNKITAYSHMICEKHRTNPVSFCIAIEVIRRASLQTLDKDIEMLGINKGKDSMKLVSQLADLYLDLTHSQIKYRENKEIEGYKPGSGLL